MRALCTAKVLRGVQTVTGVGRTGMITRYTATGGVLVWLSCCNDVPLYRFGKSSLAFALAHLSYTLGDYSVVDNYKIPYDHRKSVSRFDLEKHHLPK